jgi:AraC-like DNA-binding protein
MFKRNIPIWCITLLFFSSFFPFIVFSAEDNIHFQSDFEAGHTLIQKKVTRGDNKLLLIETKDLEDWPEGGGKGWISSPAFDLPAAFFYKKRKGDLLYGVSGIKKEYPVYSDVYTASFKDWVDVHRSNVNLVFPGIHNNAAAQINFKSKGQILLVATISPCSEFCGRFYVRFSGQALTSLKKAPGWIFEPMAPGLLRIGVIRDSVDKKPHITLRFHTKRPYSAKNDVYLTMEDPCLPDKDYCIEFHYRGVDSIQGGATFWVNDRLVASSFTHDTYGAKTATKLLFGAFSWARFKQGHIILDDVVISAKRTGPIPETPAITGPGFQFRTRDLPQFIQFQMARQNQSWFQNVYNSGIIPFESYLHTPRINLSSNTGYTTRIRVLAKNENWSDWSPQYQFTQKDVQPEKACQVPVPQDVWFTLPEKRKAVEEILPGKWYNINVSFKTGEALERVASVKLILNYFKNTLGSLLNDGYSFSETSSYFFKFGPAQKTIWCMFSENNNKTIEFSGQKSQYIDDSRKQYKVDYEKGIISATIRISKMAALGPWMLNAGCTDNKGNTSLILKKPFLVNKKAGSAQTLKIILLFSILLIAVFGSVIRILRIRKSRKTAPKEPSEGYPKSLVKRALEIIQEDIKDPDLNMEKVAKRLNISRKYLSNQFKKEIGHSFPEYLNNERLEKAKNMLKTTNLRISEIAFEIGYNTPEYFTKVFKKSEKVSPGEFRSKYA